MAKVPIRVPWAAASGHDGDVAVSTRARISRNLSKKRFQGHLGDEESTALISEIGKELAGRAGGLIVYPMADLGALDRRLLLEKNFVPAEFIMDETKSFAADPDFLTTVTLGYVDHLRYGIFDSGSVVGSVVDRAYALDTAIEKLFDFAADPELGYLGPNPANLGTGLKVSVLAHLPAIVESGLADKTFRGILQSGGDVKGFMGDEGGSLGNLYQISNRATIGSSETDLAENLDNMVGQLVHYERMARAEVYERNKVMIEDRIHRAFGILAHCRSIEMREAVELLGDVRWGIDYGLFSLDRERITELMFLVQKAHVQLLQEGATGCTVEEYRAEIVRKGMNGVSV